MGSIINIGRGDSIKLDGIAYSKDELVSIKVHLDIRGRLLDDMREELESANDRIKLLEKEAETAKIMQRGRDKQVRELLQKANDKSNAMGLAERRLRSTRNYLLECLRKERQRSDWLVVSLEKLDQS